MTSFASIYKDSELSQTYEELFTEATKMSALIKTTLDHKVDLDSPNATQATTNVIELIGSCDDIRTDLSQCTYELYETYIYN